MRYRKGAVGQVGPTRVAGKLVLGHSTRAEGTGGGGVELLRFFGRELLWTANDALEPTAIARIYLFFVFGSQQRRGVRKTCVFEIHFLTFDYSARQNRHDV